MTEAFTWVQWIAEWFAKLIPRWTIVDTTQAYVLWRKGDEVYSGGAGIIWWWPAWSRLQVHPVVRQALDLRAQILTTRDGKSILAGGLIAYRIYDIRKALVDTYDPDDTIKDVSLTVLHTVLTRMSWEEILDAERQGILTLALRKEAKRVLEPYGVRPMKFAITDLAPAKVYKHAVSSSSTDFTGQPMVVA